MIKLLILLIFVFLNFYFLINPPFIYAAPPPNFERLPVTSGLNNPTGLAFAPDGRLFILEQTGAIKIYKNGRLLPRFFDELPALAESDRGLLGIAFDPDFNTNHWVYFYYISLESKHYVVRFDASEDIGKNGPVVIWASNEVTGSNHAGGTIQFGPDGKLYISVGEGGNPPNSQNLNTVMGKILRINKDGTIPADNPFAGDSTKKGEIWAYGLRNPFRFQFDAVSGNLFEGDVGGEQWEEVNKIVKGGNYGWPLAEGNCPGCGFIEPIYTYPHKTPSFSVTGGLFYHGSLFPAEYQGSYIFGDYAQGFIKRLTFDQNGNQNGVVNFDTSAGSIVDLKTAPDGSIYYVTIFPAGLYRINYTLGNKTPVAKASANPVSGHEPLTISFSSQGSNDPDGTPLGFSWDFGDGTATDEANPIKTYPNVGKYNAFLTVTDATLSAKSAPVTINVGTPPIVDFIAPINSSSYKAGDTINYNINAKDKDGNDIDESHVSFESVFHHDSHIHPFLRPINSKSGNFVIPQRGEASANTSYELIAKATDQNNLSSTKSISIFPQKSKFTLQTDPLNFKIGLDGTPKTTPLTIEGVVGFQRELDALSQQVSNQYYEFDKWSDSGAKRHFITQPPIDTVYTASFKPAPSFTGEYFNNPNFSGPPVFTKEDTIINFSWGSGSPDPRIPNDQFSIRWTKKQFFPFGRYRFSGFSDDGILVYLDGNLVLNGWGFNRGVSSVIDIPEGLHDLRVDYLEDGGGADVGFSWDLTPDQPSPVPSSTPISTPTPTPVPTPTASPSQTPSPSPTSTPVSTPTPSPTPSPTSTPDSYNAEYFDNLNLSGLPKVVKSDPIINFVWNNEQPDPNIPADQFSVRWIKTDSFNTGIYRFNVAADDGVRLFIDGQLVLDRWVDQPVTNYTVDKYLTAGNHTIVMEYYEAFGGAVAILNYASLPDVFTGEYFDNQNLTGPPSLVRMDNKISFLWNLFSSPDPGISADHFSIRWTKKQYFKNQNYTFTLKADDGIRFWIDGHLIVDDWHDHGMTTYTPQVHLSEGIYTLKVEYYENNGNAVAILNQDN